MASPALHLREVKTERVLRDRLDSPLSGQRNRNNVNLYFPPNVIGMRTRFRDTVLNYIYRTALDLSEGRLESAAVSISSQPDEEDSLTLELTLTIDADWEFIRRLGYDILVKVGDWSKEWSEEERDDYGRRIYFGLVPSVL